MENTLHDLAKHVFYEFLDKAGRVYLLVRYSADVILGAREFTPEEKERGIMLVLNGRMKFQWDIHGITAKLVFGSTPQRCFIPLSSIVAVFSPDLGAQFALSVRHDEGLRGNIHEAAAVDADSPDRGSREEPARTDADPLFAVGPARKGAPPRTPARSRKEPPEGKLIRVDFAKKQRREE